MPLTMPRSQSSTAFAVATLGIATYSAMDAVMKGLSITSGAYSAVLWRSLAGAALTGMIFLLRGNKWPEHAALKLHTGRGFAAGLSVLLFSGGSSACRWRRAWR